MLQWPHSGFHVHAGVGVSEDDRPFAFRLARYCARNPLALDRLTYEPATEQITYRSGKADAPAGYSDRCEGKSYPYRHFMSVVHQ
jgi:hypothetical protein